MRISATPGRRDVAMILHNRLAFPLANIVLLLGVLSWPSIARLVRGDILAVKKIFHDLKHRGLTKVAILTVSTGFGVAGKEQLLAQAPQYGIQVVAQEVFGEKDTDMTPQLTKLRGTPAQAVICWGTGPAPALVAKNMKQLGLTLPLIQSHGAASKKFIELAGDYAEERHVDALGDGRRELAERGVVTHATRIHCPDMPVVGGTPRQPAQGFVGGGAVVDPGRTGVVIGGVVAVFVGGGTRARGPGEGQAGGLPGGTAGR